MESLWQTLGRTMTRRTRRTSLSTELQFQRWRKGDAQAFESIARHYHLLLMIRVRRSPSWPGLRTRCTEEDIVQEVWSQVVAHSREAFESQGPGSFCAYLCKITDNRIRSRARHHLAQKRGEGSTEVRCSDHDEQHALQKPGTPFPQTASSAARVSELQGLAAKHLSPDEYQAWHLVDNLGYTSQEAALAMGEDLGERERTDSGIRGLLMRARVKLIPLVQSAP